MTREAGRIPRLQRIKLLVGLAVASPCLEDLFARFAAADADEIQAALLAQGELRLAELLGLTRLISAP